VEEGRGEEVKHETMTRSKEHNVGLMLAVFAVLYIFWLLMSACINPLNGHFSPIHIIAGIICAGVVTLLSHDLLITKEGEMTLAKTFRLIAYVPWELWQIFLANFDVAYRVLHPKMPIDPRIIEFDTSLRSDFALTTLANSITLTPGTITIDIDPGKGRFLVHAIAKKPADALLVDKTMINKVAHVYMEEA